MKCRISVKLLQDRHPDCDKIYAIGNDTPLEAIGMPPVISWVEVIESYGGGNAAQGLRILGRFFPEGICSNVVYFFVALIVFPDQSYDY